MNDVGMNLAQGPSATVLPWLRRRRQATHVFDSFHAGAEIVFGEAHVERSAAVAGGKAAGTRGESVDQPRNAF